MANEGTFSAAAGELTLLVGFAQPLGVYTDLTIPPNTRVQVMSCCMTFTIDPTIPNRHPGFVFTRGPDEILTAASSLAFTGGVTYRINAMSGTGVTISTYQRSNLVALPTPFFLHSGDTITAWTELLNSGDLWGPIRLYCLRWIEP